MGHPRDKMPDDAGSPDQGNSEKRSGRVTYDERGNSVWEWELHTGEFSRDVNTQKVRTLDLEQLSLEDSDSSRTFELEALTTQPKFNKARAGGGFNPYDNSPVADGKGFNPYDPTHAAALRRNPPKVEAPRKPKTDLRKLSAWVKLKRAVTPGGKDEEDEG